MDVVNHKAPHAPPLEVACGWRWNMRAMRIEER